MEGRRQAEVSVTCWREAHPRLTVVSRREDGLPELTLVDASTDAGLLVLELLPLIIRAAACDFETGSFEAVSRSRSSHHYPVFAPKVSPSR